MDYLLIGLASLGHTCFLLVLLNYVYAMPLHRKFLKAFRAFIGLLILASPIVSYWLVRRDYRSTDHDDVLHWLFVIYLTAMIFVGGVVFTLITILRLIRRLPAQVLSESTITVDVEKELGRRPIGDGKWKNLAKWPILDVFRVDFTTLTIALPNIPPEWDGLTLLQLSDLHFFGTPAREYYEFVVRRCLADGVPDLLLITGDIIDRDRYRDWIEPVLKPLLGKLGSFAILGNHDWWMDADAVRDELKRIGIQVLGNGWQRINLLGQPLTLLGHEGPWFRPAPDLSDCPIDGFRLLLSHTPDNIRWAKRNNVSLMLSGHNHGGQIRMPVVGSIFVPSKYSRRYDMGTFFESPTLLHVNRGLSGKEPLRFRCRPQVTRIILRKA